MCAARGTRRYAYHEASARRFRARFRVTTGAAIEAEISWCAILNPFIIVGAAIIKQFELGYRCGTALNGASLLETTLILWSPDFGLYHTHTVSILTVLTRLS